MMCGEYLIDQSENKFVKNIRVEKCIAADTTFEYIQDIAEILNL